jgi:hypothetical protein
VSNANTSDPALLILTPSKAIAEFDHNFNNDPDYVTGTEDQLKEFALWAQCALAGKIAQLIYSGKPNNKALRIYSKQRHYSTKTAIPPLVTFQAPPPQGGPLDIFNLLNASISRQADAMELLHTTHTDTLVFHKEKETKKKDQFHKFHPSAKQLILFASASDINDVPTKPEDTCEHFMNATTQGIAEQELSMQFRAMGLGDVAYATGLTLNLYSGKFLYAVHNNPSNFSCFSIHEGNHLDKEEQQDRQLLLHLIETKGKGQSIEEIKSLNKQIIKAPTTYHEMLLQLDFFCGLCTIFFGQFSWAMHLMTSLITALEKNKHSFKARERTNPHFCSKFMYAINMLVPKCANSHYR